MKPKRVTVEQALEKLEKETKYLPPVEMPSLDPVLQLQERTIMTLISQEAIIDLLFTFGIITKEIFLIARKNVEEFSLIQGNHDDVLLLRLDVLKQKLAEFSKSRKTNVDKIKPRGNK